MAVLLTIGIVTSLLLFFEQKDDPTTDVFERCLVECERANISV